MSNTATHLTIDLDDVVRAGDVEQAILAWAEQSDDTASGVIGPEFSTSGPGPGWSKTHGASDFAERALDDGYGALYYIDAEDGRLAQLVDGEGPDDYFAAIREAEAGTESWVATATSGQDAGRKVWLLSLADGKFATAWPHDPQSWEEDDGVWDVKIPSTPEEHQAIVSLWEDRELPEAPEPAREIEWSNDSVVEIKCPSIDDALVHPRETAEMAQAVIDTHGACSDKDEWRQLIQSIRDAAEALEDIDIDDLSD